MRGPQIVVLAIARVGDVLVNPATEICYCGRASDLDINPALRE